MAKKRKVEKVGTIKAIDMIRASRPIQDIPFRTGAHENKKYKREKSPNVILTSGCNHLFF